MERRDEIELLNDRLDKIWKQLCQARDRGDWQSYWRLRRSWLSLGRLHSFLIQEQAAERSAQLTLLPDDAGRRHDREVG